MERVERGYDGYEVVLLNITKEMLLAKIEEELNEAKGSKTTEKLREKMYAIKILCELALKEGGKEQSTGTTVPLANVQANGHQLKKTVELDDDGNGDSIFDF